MFNLIMSVLGGSTKVRFSQKGVWHNISKNFFFGQQPLEILLVDNYNINYTLVSNFLD